MRASASHSPSPSRTRSWRMTAESLRGARRIRCHAPPAQDCGPLCGACEGGAHMRKATGTGSSTPACTMKPTHPNSRSAAHAQPVSSPGTRPAPRGQLSHVRGKPLHGGEVQWGQTFHGFNPGRRSRPAPLGQGPRVPTGNRFRAPTAGPRRATTTGVVSATAGLLDPRAAARSKASSCPYRRMRAP